MGAREHRDVGQVVGEGRMASIDLVHLRDEHLPRPSRSIRAWDRLLMSSEVQAKWMNSLTASNSALPAMCSLMKYSTALTS